MKVSLESLLAARMRVLLVGSPALAKTSRIKSVALAAGFKFPEPLRLSLCDRVDLGGALVPDVVAGITRQLPLDQLHYLQTTKDDVLFLIDDLGQGQIDVQAAAMKLFDEGVLSPSVLIWGATNRPADKAGCVALCEPLRSRFHVGFAMATPDSVEVANGPAYISTWKEEVEGWCNWAAGKEYAAEIVAWHMATVGRTLYQWKPMADPAARMPDFRSWEVVARLWQAGLRDLNYISAAIGKPAASEFLAFAALADQLPTPAQIWLDPHGAPVPTEPAAQYLIASMLARAVEPKFASQLVIYFSRLPRVQAAFCARAAYKRLGAKLAGSNEWHKWFMANSALFESNVK